MTEFDEKTRRLLEQAAAANEQTAADFERMLESSNFHLADLQAIVERQAEIYKEFDAFLKEKNDE